MKIYNNWFLLCIALILAITVLLLGFSMGQQVAPNDCKRFGMFHYSGNIYSCQQVKANEVVVTSFKESAK